ncbi:hypothetical protein, partial [Streptomyces sp. NRRL S-813]|uniref:hypothetical protein n=1 Tax=Streptomyces sp. NRRL S-813 TaxID=1463919 RepID=UPI001F2E4F5B
MLGPGTVSSREHRTCRPRGASQSDEQPLSDLGFWLNFRLRREALLVRVEVENLHQPAVAAVGLKLRAA